MRQGLIHTEATCTGGGLWASALVLLCIAILAAALGGCGNRQIRLQKVTIAVNDWPPSTALYVADEKGYFKDEGLDVKFRSYASGYEAFAATMSGKAQFATLADTPIAFAAVRNEPFLIVATICEIDRPDSIIARRDKGIATVAGLRGKRIGVARGTSADFFLHVYLTSNYIDEKDVHIVDVPAGKVVDALVRGQVDAVCTWTQYAAVLQRDLGANALVLEDPDIYSMSWNLAATRTFVKQHPGSVEKLLRAVVRSNGFIKENPVEARAIAARRTATKPTELEQRWNTYNFETVLDQSLIVSVEDQAKWIVDGKENGSRKIPNVMDFVYTDALKKVQHEGVTIPGR